MQADKIQQDMIVETDSSKPKRKVAASKKGKVAVNCLRPRSCITTSMRRATSCADQNNLVSGKNHLSASCPL